MRKYIKPEMECRMAMVESLLETTSLTVSDTEVSGGNALGKNNIWDDDEDK